LPSGEYQPAAGILVNSSTGLIITNNIVYNNALSGIYAFRIFDSIIANNTVTSTQYGIAVYARGITVINNIITNCDNALLYDYYAEVKGIPSGVSEGVFILDYNLLYNNESNYSGVNQGEHDILVDPKFVNPSEFNFNLQSNSPAINVGADLDVVTEDIVQVPRPQGGSFDIGAYEYYSLLVSLTPLSPDPTTKTKPTFAGTATTVSGVNIKSIYYSIDGGAWVSSGVKATDGVFNCSQEKFTITLPTALSTGNHTIRVKAEDTSLSMSNISQDSFVIRAYTVVNAASEPVTQNTPSPDEDTPDTVDPTPLMPSNIIHEEPPVLNNVQSNDGHLNIILLLCLSLVAAALVFFVLYTTKKKAKVSSSQ